MARMRGTPKAPMNQKNLNYEIETRLCRLHLRDLSRRYESKESQL